MIFSREIYKVSKFIAKNKLSEEVKGEMRGYLAYLFQEDHNRRVDDEEYLTIMPSILQKKILADKYHKLLLKVPVFRKNFRIEVLKKLSVQFKERILGHGDEIFPVISH